MTFTDHVGEILILTNTVLTIAKIIEIIVRRYRTKHGQGVRKEQHDLTMTYLISIDNRMRRIEESPSLSIVKESKG